MFGFLKSTPEKRLARLQRREAALIAERLQIMDDLRRLDRHVLDTQIAITTEENIIGKDNTIYMPPTTAPVEPDDPYLPNPFVGHIFEEGMGDDGHYMIDALEIGANLKFADSNLDIVMAPAHDLGRTVLEMVRKSRQIVIVVADRNSQKIGVDLPYPQRGTESVGVKIITPTLQQIAALCCGCIIIAPDVDPNMETGEGKLIDLLRQRQRTFKKPILINFR